jgi:hypothetical protein
MERGTVNDMEDLLKHCWRGQILFKMFCILYNDIVFKATFWDSDVQDSKGKYK